MHEDRVLFEEGLPEEENTPQEIPATEVIPEEEQEQAPQASEDTPTVEGETEEVSPTEDETEAPGEEVAPAEDETETPAEEVSAEEGETEPAEEELPKELPYHERYYLRYHDGKRSTAMDLEGTMAFLQDMGFDGGELRQARAGKNRAESYRKLGKGKKQMRCSYCGAEISGVEFYRLPDGRMRCTTCSNSLVQTKAEAEEICKRVLINMESFFGAAIDVPISFEIVDERKLKRRIGVPLGTRDSQSMLILGVAINKKKKYSIILENGAPRISLIATFAHELTHIWQYTHWDNRKKFKKCPKDKRLLIYEGMAKWAEIQYLYLVGETDVARREEAITRNRQDEYGIGFCMYEDQFPLSRETMTCEETPFTPNGYPL